ncbi:MAG: tyrosine-type recombinase/integrase [Chloroflexi bacterium]|nr:tyrosine-type recombinase/integrase [Chloroflexota bacterium]
MSNLVRRDDNPLSREQRPLTFNLAAVLPGRASSRHTERAYFRWIETLLVDLAGWRASIDLAERAERMTHLPVQLLQATLSAQQLRAWLGMLIRRNHSKQGINQARAAVVTLGDLLAEAGWINDLTAATLARVKTPKAESGQRTGRWLSPLQLRAMIIASTQIATTPTQAARNLVVMSILCTMALRREELAVARWGDLSLQNNRVVLKVHGKGRKVAGLDVPRPVVTALEAWRRLCVPVTKGVFQESMLVRRVWKGGRISKGGVTPEGILLLVDASAKQAGVGTVAPHDLRRSVAGALYEAKVPIDTISRLLRHSNVAVTERYIKGLQLPNEGALMMSDILAGLDDIFPDFPGFE